MNILEIIERTFTKIQKIKNKATYSKNSENFQKKINIRRIINNFENISHKLDFKKYLILYI